MDKLFGEVDYVEAGEREGDTHAVELNAYQQRLQEESRSKGLEEIKLMEDVEKRKSSQI
jgi:hypothetical protein